MNFLLAPDSFKECMSAWQAALIMREAIERVDPAANTELAPVGDGGEGTMDVLVRATGGAFYEKEVTGPLGQPVKARYAVLGDGKTAAVEMAEASGLHLVPPDLRNPMLTTSFGTGELMKAALDHGIQHLLVMLGGSATNDGGAGMLQALGAEVLDSRMSPVGFGGGSLKDTAIVRLAGLDPRLKEITLDVACDVTNPLSGEKGASHVFGPQKGATPDMVLKLDAYLKNFGEKLEQESGMGLQHVPGAGAAGGLGAALLACGGVLKSGIDLVLDLLSFDEKLERADYVLTGEGKIDSQTPEGKVIAGIVRRAHSRNVPVLVFAGTVRPGYEELYARGLLSVQSIMTGPGTLKEALEQGPQNLQFTVENTVRLITGGRTDKV
ncbi:glycerate kinase family protein [Paenibacillus gansuensis]|uniref:Glycerate kinase n=1 Tax=Paenibacillus gansuensis TaxID=306542 RepID=A0ABW5PAX5_9BACL